MNEMNGVNITLVFGGYNLGYKSRPPPILFILLHLFRCRLLEKVTGIPFGAYPLRLGGNMAVFSFPVPDGLILLSFRMNRPPGIWMRGVFALIFRFSYRQCPILKMAPVLNRL